MASLLRLWLSVAIYLQLIILTLGDSLSECKGRTSGKYYCYGVKIEEAADFIWPNATEIEFFTIKQKHLALSFQSYFPILNTLKFVNGELKTIATDSLQGLTDLENLEFTNNKLSRLEQDSLLGLVNLKTLGLQQNEFSFLKDVLEALLSVRNLTYLDLSYNLFESITFEEAEKLTNLTVAILKLNGCRINNVDPLVLTNWNIDELYISNNPIDEKCLKNISLGLRNSNVRKLEILKPASIAFRFNETPLLPLYSSKIQKLVIGESIFGFVVTFRSFFSLTDLKFINSEINGIDFDEWTSLPHLEHLELSGNRIGYQNKVPRMNNGSVLKTLKLRRNRSLYPEIPVISEDLFTSFSNLFELTVEETLFGNVITAKTFLGLHQLLKLRINWCSIEEVEDGAFGDLESLELLSLEANKLHFLRKEMFIGLSNLTLLHLSFNLLTLVSESSPFSLLTNLELLDLRNNKIERLKPSYFTNLTKLQVISLGNNMIVPWNIKVIPEGGNVSVMLLQSNKLSIITPTMLEEFCSLQFLNLADNDFDCWNCDILTFQKWIMSTNVTLLDLDKKHPNTYTCQYPQPLKGEFIGTATLDREHCDEEQDKTILLTVIFSCTSVIVAISGIASYKLRWHFRYCCYLLRSRVKRFKETRDSFSYEYDAFVSYDPSDYNWIRNHLVATLETDTNRIRLCLLERDCVAGNDLMEETLEVIQKCRKTLLVLSESYMKNQWCMFELHMAQHSLFEEKRDSLILIQLQPIEKEMISANLAYLITTRTYIMWIEHPMGQKMFWKRLLAAIAKPDTLRMSHIV